MQIGSGNRKWCRARTGATTNAANGAQCTTPLDVLRRGCEIKKEMRRKGKSSRNTTTEPTTGGSKHPDGRINYTRGGIGYAAEQVGPNIALTDG